MFKKRVLSYVLVCTAVLLLVASVGTAAAQDPAGIEELGGFLYFDENLSEPTGQSCASCHDPAFGFVDPDSDIPVSEGVIPGRFGGRNSPSSAYAMYAPFFDDVELIGGQFWDGRAETLGDLGDPLASQALGPFTNFVEMNNPDRRTVIRDVAQSSYKDLFELVWPSVDLDNWETMPEADVDYAYERVALSIAAFERTELFAPFSSQYDAYLQACLAAGETPDNCAKGIGKTAAKVGKKFFSKEEWYGLQLFMNENNNNDGILEKGEGAMCVACHIADWTTPEDYVLSVQVPTWSGNMIPPLFTDFTYDNLGVPKSDHPHLVNNPVDIGLGEFVEGADGMFKVMTLRNIGLTPPYAHNGYFESLKDITHFYNTRDVPGSLKKGADWPPPEVPINVNDAELGSLGLSDADEDALVEFMKTLSDGYKP